jgi:hypothetical protein
MGQGDAKEGGEHQDLQDVILRQRVDDTGRHHVEHEVDEAVRLFSGWQGRIWRGTPSD